jgi:phage baseplate assembly protein V
MIEDLYRRLRNRVDAMVTRAVINRVNDKLKTQRLQLTLLEGDVEDGVEHMQPFGLSFTPPNGAEAIALSVGGARSHTIALCANMPGQRPTDAPAGTGGLYTGGEWRLYIDEDGVVHVGAQSGAEFIALAQKVLDELNAIKADLDGLKAAYDGHIHTTTATVGLGPALGVIAPTTATAPTPHTPQSVAATKAKAT